MTEQNPAIFLQAESHPAEDVRRFIAALTNDTEGIHGPGDLEVTEKSGTPDMSVDVAGGRAFIAGSEETYQGTYFVENRGNKNLTISAADATNPRKDLIVAKVEDSDVSGATDAWSLAVVTGTPAASPSDPTAPDNSITLARVNVAALASSIADANIDDLRQTAGAVATGADLPASGPLGSRLWVVDEKRHYLWDGDRWVPAEPAVLFRVSRTGADFTTTSAADVTGFDHTFTAYSDRLYRTRVWGRVSTPTAAELQIALTIQDTPSGGGTQIQGVTWKTDGVANDRVGLVCEVVETGLSGSIRRLARLAVASGSGTAELESSSTTPVQMTIEDLGPVP